MVGGRGIAKAVAARAGRLLAVLCAVAVLAFTLAKMSPIDPIDAYLGINVARAGDAQRQLIAEAWGLNQPVIMQFFAWAGNIASGDLGWSFTKSAPVGDLLVRGFLASLPLMAGAWLLSGILGFVLGVIAGAYKDSWADKIIHTYAYVLASAPTFWLAILLLIFFSVQLGVTPVCCSGPIGVSPDDVTIWQRLHHMILPLIAIAILGVSQVTLHTRAKMIEIMRSDYVLYALAQGASRWDVAWRNGARNAALPALTVVFASLGELFGGSVLAEQVFAYPGLGRMTVEAGLSGDIPLLLGITLAITALISVGNMIADLAYLIIDPRMRSGFVEREGWQ